MDVAGLSASAREWASVLSFEFASRLISVNSVVNSVDAAAE